MGKISITKTTIGIKKPTEALSLLYLSKQVNSIENAMDIRTTTDDMENGADVLIPLCVPHHRVNHI